MHGAMPAISTGCSFAELRDKELREDNKMSQTGTSELPKEASAPVFAQHAATLKALPFSDTRVSMVRSGFWNTWMRIVSPAASG